MGSIVFEGQQPFELVSAHAPRAAVENGSITLTLPVFIPEAPAQSVEIQVILTLEHAAALAAELQPVLATAKNR